METGTIGVSGVDFVALPTQDAEEAARFYGEVVGLERGKQWGEMPAYEFETGSLTIAVMQTDAFGIDFSPNATPVALHVDDVEQARSELEGRGVTFAQETMDSGVCHMAFFQDPDGNQLILHHRYAPKDQGPGSD